MGEPERISTRQLAVLLLFVTIGDMLLVLPPHVAELVKQDAWIAHLLGVAAGLGIAWLLLKFALALGSEGLVERNRRTLGTWAGGAVSAVYMLYFLLNSSLMMRETSDFLTTVLFPETPLRAIHGLAALAFVVGIRYGLQSIARAGELFLPVFGILYAILLLLLLPQVQPGKLQPMLAADAVSMLEGIYISAIYPFCELCVFIMVIPLVVRRKHMKRDYLLAVAVGGLSSFAVMLMSILVLGGVMTAHYLYPAYILAGKINVGHFIERLESLIAVNLILLTFMKTVLFGYGFAMVLAQMFRLDDYRPLAFPTGMLVFGLAYFMWPNVVEYNDGLFRYWGDLDVLVGILLPLALLGLYKWRSPAKGGKASEGKRSTAPRRAEELPGNDGS